MRKLMHVLSIHLKCPKYKSVVSDIDGNNNALTEILCKKQWYNWYVRQLALFHMQMQITFRLGCYSTYVNLSICQF